jgi:hypothetical protein
MWENKKTRPVEIVLRSREGEKEKEGESEPT